MTTALNSNLPSSGAYVVIGDDAVIELDDIPSSSPGSPLPVVLATEHSLCVTFLLHAPEPDWNDPSSIESLTSGEKICILNFSRARSHYFGSPNDETLHGHPLYSRGLRSYGNYEVRNSSWINALERMNSAHPKHDPARFKHLRHIVLTFHDSIFECVAERFTVEIRNGQLSEVVAGLARSLR